MPGDVQPVPLLVAAGAAVTQFSVKNPPPFIEVVIAPNSYGRFPTAYQVEAAIRAEAKLRATLPDTPSYVEEYDQYCSGEFYAPKLPKPPAHQMREVRAATRCSPNGQWVVFVITVDHDSKSYW